MALGRREHFVEQREEFFAAVVFALDFGEQSLVGPLAAPGRRRRGIIEQRAEREPRSLHLIVGNPGGERAALEAVDLLAQPCAQAGRIGMAHRVADLRHGSEDRICGFDQRVQAPQGGEIGGRGMALDRRRERAAFSPRGRKNYGCIGVVDLLSTLAHLPLPNRCPRARPASGAL